MPQFIFGFVYFRFRFVLKLDSSVFVFVSFLFSFFLEVDERITVLKKGNFYQHNNFQEIRRKKIHKTI
jgi:ABC-type sugar transport system ATPase subunit